jgi:hypothetical protein
MTLSANPLPARVALLRPCSCGHIPSIIRSLRNGISIVRVECACGKLGACLMFTKEADRERMEQAAGDGWNMADMP